ncbi:hypothetical protein [Paraburkholderia terricola]|uniref:hypothetical protein n=1 Tax=Paraburkholderia terricola TaxID=169427 RepID=UPI002859468D|nr:hypothetical protein [Paraburkholderia terricola]MDR6482870.1 hypothetical protein [Paraburkholderia terricola]
MNNFCFNDDDRQFSISSFAPVSTGVTPGARSGYMQSWRLVESNQTAREIKRREAVVVTEVPDVDVAVLPGHAVTEEALSSVRNKAQLIELIERFKAEGFARGDEDLKITEATAQASSRLFEMLPLAAPLPKIAPDGEGGLTAIWTQTADAVVLVVAGWHVSMVVAAATPRAEYFDDLPFDGAHLPQALIEAISLR